MNLSLNNKDLVLKQNNFTEDCLNSKVKKSKSFHFLQSKHSKNKWLDWVNKKNLPENLDSKSEGIDKQSQTSNIFEESKLKNLYGSGYSKLHELKLVSIGIASSEKIKEWAEKVLPNGKIFGEVTNANTLHYKTFKPHKGGLFCERIFGPLKDFECACGIRSKPTEAESKKILEHEQIIRSFCPNCDVEYTWSVIRRYQLGYIQLISPVSHIWYLKANPSYLSLLLDLRRSHLESIIYCTQAITLENLWKSSQTLGLDSSPSSLYSIWQKLLEEEKLMKTKQLKLNNILKLNYYLSPKKQKKLKKRFKNVFSYSKKQEYNFLENFPCTSEPYADGQELILNRLLKRFFKRSLKSSFKNSLKNQAVDFGANLGSEPQALTGQSSYKKTKNAPKMSFKESRLKFPRSDTSNAVSNGVNSTAGFQKKKQAIVEIQNLTTTKTSDVFNGIFNANLASSSMKIQNKVKVESENLSNFEASLETSDFEVSFFSKAKKLQKQKENELNMNTENMYNIINHKDNLNFLRKKWLSKNKSMVFINMYAKIFKSFYRKAFFQALQTKQKSFYLLRNMPNSEFVLHYLKQSLYLRSSSKKYTNKVSFENSFFSKAKKLQKPSNLKKTQNLEFSKDKQGEKITKKESMKFKTQCINLTESYFKMYFLAFLTKNPQFLQNFLIMNPGFITDFVDPEKIIDFQNTENLNEKSIKTLFSNEQTQIRLIKNILHEFLTFYLIKKQFTSFFLLFRTLKHVFEAELLDFSSALFKQSLKNKKKIKNNKFSNPSLKIQKLVQLENSLFYYSGYSIQEKLKKVDNVFQKNPNLQYSNSLLNNLKIHTKTNDYQFSKIQNKNKYIFVLKFFNLFFKQSLKTSFKNKKNKTVSNKKQLSTNSTPIFTPVFNNVKNNNSELNIPLLKKHFNNKNNKNKLQFRKKILYLQKQKSISFKKLQSFSSVSFSKTKLGKTNSKKSKNFRNSFAFLGSDQKKETFFETFEASFETSDFEKKFKKQKQKETSNRPWQKNAFKNYLYTISYSFPWSLDTDWKSFLYYNSAPKDFEDIQICYYKNRKLPYQGLALNTGELGSKIHSPITGAAMVQKLLSEYKPSELKKMVKQHQILLPKLNRTIRKWKEKASKKADFVKIQKLLQKRDHIIRRLKLIHKFSRKNSNIHSMILSVLPVLPPDLRPILKLQNQIAASDLNRLYQRIIYRNERLKKFLKDPSTSQSFEMKYAQRLLQEAVDNLIQNGKGGVKPETNSRGQPLKSLSEILKGKQGRFRQYLLGKRVDYSGRSVIVVGPKLKLNECGLPKEMAIELFLPFLIKRILHYKLAKTVIGAKNFLYSNKKFTWNLLNEIMKNHPVLLNRAPTLHRLGIQAFQPKLIEGRAILLHPLVCPAFNADFDGDQMAVHVPITVEARAEAWTLMFSRNHLISPATGEPIVLPSQDMVLGCYYLTSENPLVDNFKPKLQKTISSGIGSPKKNINTDKMSEQTPTEVSYFTRALFWNFESILTAYQLGRIFLQSIVWVQWNGITEFSNEPLPSLEIRINRFGYREQIKSKYSKRIDYKGMLLNQYIRTTPGRVLLNSTAQKCMNL
uniref:DNA-directed RNA polymerase subunit beta' n=1 Tax=Chlorotetraedron incus TaxID=162317 RepID=A0A140HAD7_9CHLO|nr:beta subunit of RNA polymerase [Chlorotetraedron incus]AMO01136.1 beta subunit of RNA polymerase [Chlorotetraedron incus]